MANVIKYKGQLYRRVDSADNALKALKYKGQMFKRVDSVQASPKLKHLMSEIKSVHTKHFKPTINLDVSSHGLGNTHEGETYLFVRFDPITEGLSNRDIWKVPELAPVSNYHYFVERNGRIIDASHPEITEEHFLKALREADRLVDTKMQKAMQKHIAKKELERLVTIEAEKELTGRLHKAKGFKRMTRHDIDVDWANISFVVDCSIPHNDELDDDDRKPILKAFTNNVISALHGFAKVRFDIDEFTRGDDGTPNSEPVAFNGKLEKAWIKSAQAKVSK